MSQVNVNHDQARVILAAAIEAAKSSSYKPRHPKMALISDVMLGSHLTYRYVLFTNLLAKATNGLVNALALQAKAELTGAFDSRSLCHKVVVDFDRDPNYLSGKLGRSNEPYLNKPARYPSLSLENAVRRGSDSITLQQCINILGGLRDKNDARAALEDAIFYTLKRESLVANVVVSGGDANLHQSLLNFANLVVSLSNEGESCAIIAGLGFYLIGRGTNSDFEIRVHPVNQAGSSSREVLDIDVYVSGVIYYTAEIKDKIFNINDIDHAASKVLAGGLNSLFFIFGPRSSGCSEYLNFSKIFSKKGVRVSFVEVLEFFRTALGFSPRNITSSEVWGFVEGVMRSARVKDATRSHVFKSAKLSGLIEV